MSFSQQSYTGQGIVQQNVVDRSGENLARGISAFGKGIARGIEGRAKIKSEAASLRTKLAPFADDLAETYGVEPGNWKAFLDDKGLSDLRGISDGFIVSMAKQLHDREVAKEQRAIDTQDQTAAVVKGFLQSSIPGEVPVQKTDFTPRIEEAQAEVQRLDEGIKNFAPTIRPQDVRMQPPAPVIDRPQETERFKPTFAERFGPSSPLDKSVLTQGFEAAKAQKLESQIQDFMGRTPQPNQQDVAQVMEQTDAFNDNVRQLEEAKEQLKALEAKQQAELDKPDTRPQTQEELNQSRAKTINKLIEDNPLAAGTIYTLLMGPNVDPPKLDAEARKAIGFANRMESADQELAKISDKYDRSGPMQGILSVIPSQLKSQERRQYEAVMMDWITANLRRESGAAIGQEEYKNDRLKYFPSAGDSDETMKLKAQLRKNAVLAITKPIEDSFKTGRGMSFPNFSTSPQAESSKPKVRYGDDGQPTFR